MLDEEVRAVLAEREKKYPGDLSEIAKGKLYHVNRLDGLQVVLPTDHDIKGRMPEPAVFVTSARFISIWKDYVLDPPATTTVYLYEVEAPENCRLEPGVGEYWRSVGDYKIVTDRPLPVRFVKELVLGDYHDYKIDQAA